MRFRVRRAIEDRAHDGRYLCLVAKVSDSCPPSLIVLPQHAKLHDLEAQAVGRSRHLLQALAAGIGLLGMSTEHQKRVAAPEATPDERSGMAANRFIVDRQRLGLAGKQAHDLREGPGRRRRPAQGASPARDGSQQRRDLCRG